MIFPVRAIVCCVMLLSYQLPAQIEFIRIYPGPAPGSEGTMNKEAFDSGRVSQVWQPEIMPFFPAAPDPARTCVIICPGGGYRRLAIEKEGYKIATWLAENGIQAWVLKYRLNPEQALNDLRRTIRFLRYHSEKYGINRENTGVMGFSAGGHLVVNAALNPRDNEKQDAIDSISYAPAFVASIYGLLEPRNQRIDSLLSAYSFRDWITKNTPPFFLLHAADDTVVPIEYTERFYSALKARGFVPEMHLYSRGGHGFGIETNRGEISKWLPIFYSWLKEKGFATGH